MEKTAISITGAFQKDNGTKFTEKEDQEFRDKFFEFFDNSNYSFVGFLK